MLGRLVLILLQVSLAWYGAPQIMKHIPVNGDPRLFVMAALFALVAYLVGLLGAGDLPETFT